MGPSNERFNMSPSNERFNMSPSDVVLRRQRSRTPPKLRAPAKQGTGRVRWYNGRRQTGIIDADNGKEIIIPVGGAPNRNLVPATAGGLVHGTRVSFTPLKMTASPELGDLAKLGDAKGGERISACA